MKTGTSSTVAHSKPEALGAPWKKFFAAMFVILSIFTVYRVYQEATAFTFGLDYFHPDFSTYWMNLLYAQLITIGVLGLLTQVYLWRTRDLRLDDLAPREELRRLFVLMTHLLAFVAVFYVTGSIYTEADAAWHQVTIRDTDFTPTHIGLFYFGVPMVIYLGVTAFMYARTRIPMFARRVSIPFLIIISGAVMIMPNVGFNEWGHTFFYAEELFAAPIHYGFVLLGWSTFAAGGLFVQILGRISVLSRLPSEQPLTAAAQGVL